MWYGRSLRESSFSGGMPTLPLFRASIKSASSHFLSVCCKGTHLLFHRCALSGKRRWSASDAASCTGKQHSAGDERDAAQRGVHTSSWVYFTVRPPAARHFGGALIAFAGLAKP